MSIQPATMAVTGDAFRRAMGSFASGVTIVTALDTEGHLQGLTASAFSSLSLDPPLVLVCIGLSARCYGAIGATRRFGVHIVQSDQADLAKGFARTGVDREGLCAWRRTAHGVPLLDKFHMAIECELRDIHRGGDHAIMVGRVLSIHTGSKDSAPLLYYGGQMFPMLPPQHPGSLPARSLTLS